MNKKPILIAFSVLALVTLACGANINLPVRNIKTGPTQTDDILVAIPDDTSARLNISFGAGELNITPGGEENLVSGEATYNVDDFKPVVNVNGNRVTLNTGDLEIRGIPSFEGDIKNEWDIEIGNFPLDLRLSAGAYQAEIELGGLSIQSLEVTDGAADVELSFSEPNQIEMDSFQYETGASTVSLTGLANTKAKSLVFRGGAGDYTLDFSGELEDDMDVSIDAGMCNIVIIIPEGMAAEVQVKGLVNVDTNRGWNQSGQTYTLSGDGPTLYFTVNIGAGNLELRQR